MSPWYEGSLPVHVSETETITCTSEWPATSHSYYYARLVMDRHLHGPTHGPPSHKLGHLSYTLYSSDGVVNTVSQHARIVDCLLSVKTMSHSRGDSTWLRSHIDYNGYFICSHLTLGDGWPDHAPRQLPELAKDEATPSPFLPCDQAFGSCTICLTDYSINIFWQGEKKGYVVKVFVYLQLGEC